MSPRDQLNSYIKSLQGRLRLGALLRGGAVLTSAALAATVILVLIANHYGFSSGSITGARVLLVLVIAAAVGFGLALPLYGLDRRRAAGSAEQVFPQFEQRLLTFAERDRGTPDPFLELLAADTLNVAGGAQAAEVIPNSRLLAAMATAAASLAVLVWMVAAGPGYLGHGAALLWTGSHSVAPFYDIHVTPGNATVRRNSDQMINAQLTGLAGDNVRLYARYQSASKWEQVSMQPQPGGPGFQFLFAGLPENVEYYVEAGPIKTQHFTLRVIDLPAVKNIRVTYRYPSWTGLKDVVEERGGDLHAVEGSEADLEITTDGPVRDGVLVLNNDQQVKLEGGGNVYKGTVKLDQDGSYHVAALDQGQPVRLSDDFFIEAQKANPPDVRISRPGRDYRASPIEEVTVAVHAEDQFGLGAMALHYSVNGGPEQTVDLLKQKGVKQADGSTLLSLENFKLVPGDLVSVYATAKDAHAEGRTDMFFIQADPFERDFYQSQQMGGGGGGMGMGNQAQISEREKEIIASTWKQQNDKNASKQAAAESARFLSDVQGKLQGQALSLAGRMQRRELTEANGAFSDFQKDMNAAAQAMGPAAEKLKQQKWAAAVPDEQKALQHLLRAEATFRQIQVAFGGRGGAGGGGAGRDLQSLFDLELDTEKNQYETAQTANSSGSQSQDIDDALRKLDQLARREQDLAEQQRAGNQSFEQRWQQEMLRREEEQLRRQIEELARNQQGQQSGSQSNSQSGSQSGQSGSQSASQAGGGQGQGGASDPRVQQALDQLKRAQEDMARAASPGQNQADARRAADRLRSATDLLRQMQQQRASGQLGSMANEASRLAQNERQQAQRMRQMFGSNNGLGQGQFGMRGLEAGGLAGERQQLADDLQKLQQQMQQAEGQLRGTQDGAANKLRDALGGMEQNDLEREIERSAQAMRRGMDPSSASNEPAIAGGLDQLQKQLQQAQQALAAGSGQQQDAAQLLDRVDRLRRQMESLTRSMNGRNGGQNGQQGQGQQGQGQQGQQGQNGQGQGQGGQQGGQQAGRNGSPQGGFGPAFGGDYQGGNYGGYRGGRYGDIDTGGQVYQPGGRPVTPDNSPISTERAYNDAMRELQSLRNEVRGQPGPMGDISELLKQMQQLDPKRFPGNPAMVEALSNQLLGQVDKLELELRRQMDDQQSGQVRQGDSMTVPPGYQESVAEYFRRLSKKPQ